MNKSKIVNKCRGFIRLPLLLKTHVGGRFLFFRRWFCRHVIVEKVCTKYCKTGFGMPEYVSPPCPPVTEYPKYHAVADGNTWYAQRGITHINGIEIKQMSSPNEYNQ
jgi:hypothetical protein